MKLTPTLEQAIRIACTYHAGQKRKDGKTPYVFHPISIAFLLTEYTTRQDIIIAALLHDLIEDTKYTPEELEKDFGTRIKNTVMYVTEVERKKWFSSNWKTRKNTYLDNLKKASQAALMVSAADKIHNLRSLTRSYEAEGEAVFNKFGYEKGDRLWFQREILHILEKRLSNPIVKEYRKTFNKANKLFG